MLSSAPVQTDSPAKNVHAVLEDHGLPKGRFVRLWGGMGSERRCDACGQSIESYEVEFESEFRDGAESITLLLHRSCWEHWHLDDPPL